MCMCGVLTETPAMHNAEKSGVSEVRSEYATLIAITLLAQLLSLKEIAEYVEKNYDNCQK